MLQIGWLYHAILWLYIIDLDHNDKVMILNETYTPDGLFQTTPVPNCFMLSTSLGLIVQNSFRCKLHNTQYKLKCKHSMKVEIIMQKREQPCCFKLNIIAKTGARVLHSEESLCVNSVNLNVQSEGLK